MTSQVNLQTPLLEASAISLSVGGRQILQNVNLTLSAGEIVTLIGPNGAGKTTLVKIILGLIKPDTGVIKRKHGIKTGYMPQRLHISPDMPITVERFLLLSGQSKSTILQALDEVAMCHLLHSPLQQISGGEMQRVLLARALLQNPQLLVLDEPAQGVDIAGQAELYQLISTIRNRYQCGVLMISHDLHWVMAQTDTVVCLNHHICCHGHPEQVSSHPAYLALFNQHPDQALAIYHHNHDHDHDIHGDIIHPQKTP